MRAVAVVLVFRDPPGIVAVTDRQLRPVLALGFATVQLLDQEGGGRPSRLVVSAAQEAARNAWGEAVRQMCEQPPPADGRAPGRP